MLRSPRGLAPPDLLVRLDQRIDQVERGPTLDQTARGILTRCPAVGDILLASRELPGRFRQPVRNRDGKQARRFIGELGTCGRDLLGLPPSKSRRRVLGHSFLR